MFGLKKKNRIVSIELNDFFIRALTSNDEDLTTATVFDFPLPPGIIQEEVIQDEMAFYEILKELVKDWNISKYDLRFFVPDHAVLMRTFTHPEEFETSRLSEYIEMELGRSIHLPFENPLIDVYDHQPNDGEAVLFAAPSEDVVKLIGLFEDVHLNPTVLDVRALSNLRFLKNTKLFTEGKTYLIADWSVNAVSISIYSNGNVDFLRYQPIETPTRNWRYFSDESNRSIYRYEGDIAEYHIPLTDQAMEMERILNFYRFSLHKGEESVDEIIMVGENPEIDFIIKQMKSTIEIPIHVIDDTYVKKFYPSLEARHIALIGLALKEES